MTPLEFRNVMLARGIEVIVRRNSFTGEGGRLAVWPAKAWKYLTDAEREFFRSHRDELKSLALTDPRETTVEWKPPADSTPPKASVCEYCRAECVGQDDPRFEILHYRDPLQTERREKRQREIALQNMRPLR